MHRCRTRPEIQIAGDWLVLPGTRNLHRRYAVFLSALVECKPNNALGESSNKDLEELVEATKQIWQRIAANAFLIDKQERNQRLYGHVVKHWRN